MLHVHYSILHKRMQELEQFTGSLCHFWEDLLTISNKIIFIFLVHVAAAKPLERHQVELKEATLI